MKNEILKLTIVAMLFMLVGAGCQKDDIFELQIGDENAVIVKEVDGIEFKFCLLNEQGEPATVFNEGENFSFQFTFKNLKKDTIIVTTEFINNEFFRVYKVCDNESIDMGKPWTGVWCDFSGRPHEFNMETNSMTTIHFPWILGKDSKDLYPLCSSIRLEPLSVGEYMTRFDSEFHYQEKGKKRIINKLKFKINFKVK